MPPAQLIARVVLLPLLTATLTLTVGQGGLSGPERQVALLAAPAPGPGGGLLPGPEPADEGRLHVRPTALPRALAPVRVVHRRPAPPAPRRRHASRSRRVAQVSFAEELQRAVARIPLYRPGLARWVVWPRLGNYAVTERRSRTVYVSPRVPRRLLYSVVVHEWGHVISTYGYGDLRSADAAVLQWYGGGSAAAAIERAADCVARQLGATWTHYTSCADGHWRLGARYLAVGWRLPDQQASA
jgi:hypothetical protein